MSMEAFKRLRSRRKSKGQADSFVSFAEAESGLKSPTSPWQSSTGRSSVTVSRPSDAEKKLSHDQFRQPNSPTESRGPGSSGRIQPMLIEISRPFSNSSRPGTAESLQNALDRVANSASYSPARRMVSPSRQLSVKTEKYIDIFAIAGQTTKPATTFNEDVAARNLDTIALAIEEEPLHYEPTSKYQEEVATRNTHQGAAQHTSSLQSPALSENLKSSSGHSESVASHNRQPQSEETARHRRLQDLTAYHARQNSSRVRGATDHLPAIPQERSSEDFATNLGIRNKTMISRVEKELAAETSHGSELHARDNRLERPDYDKPLPSSPRTEDRLRVSDLSSYATSTSNRKSDISTSQFSERSTQESQKSARQSIDRKFDRIPGYQISANEARTRSKPTASNLQKNDVHVDNTGRLEPLRPPSTMSSTSSVKRSMTVGNRRVMDLTGDDAEVFSIVSYMNTPVISDATTGAFQKVKPAVVENPSPNKIVVGKDPAIPNSRWSSALEPVLDLDQLARRSQMLSDTGKAAATTIKQPVPLPKERSKTPPPKTLAFSPIQTLTATTPPKTFTFSSISTLSTSPRSSHIAASPQEKTPASLQKLPASELDQSTSHEDTKAPELDSVSQQSSTRVSAKIAPLVKVFADVSPDDTEEIPHPVNQASRTLPKRSDSQRLSREDDAAQRRDGKKREKTLDSSTDSMRRSVKIVVPAGPIVQEAVPGVKTRDFAIMSTEKPTVKRIEALTERKRIPGNPRRSSKEDVSSSSAMKSSSSDKKHRSRPSRVANKTTLEENPIATAASGKKPERKTEKKSSRKSTKQTSNKSKKSRPVSLFDEEAFKRKQTEANAALLRLQQSLQENLDDTESGQETPRGTATPAERALSPVTSISKSRTPNSTTLPTQHHPSPSEAAIAMIEAATSSPKKHTRPIMNGKSYSEYKQSSQDHIKSSSLLRSNTGNDLPTVRSFNSLRTGATALNPMLAHIDRSNKPPPSPGEVSLSAFPLPMPRPISPEANEDPPIYIKDVAQVPVRQGSQASRVSSTSTSTFSIPFTMVPGRGSSLPMHRFPVSGPSTTNTMDSINSIIPPSKPAGVDTT